MKKIVLRGTPSAPPPMGYSKNICFLSNTTRSNWIFRMFENKLQYTLVHAFLSDSELIPDELSQVDTPRAERLDYNIILYGSIKKLDETSTLTICSFVMYTKACAEAFIEMIFNNYPRINKILFPSSHQGIESAIKKCMFSELNGII